jgi:hypothetical protein
MKNVFSETGVKVPNKFGNFQVGNALDSSREGPCSRELPRFFAACPRKLLDAWLPLPRPTGRPQQTIRHGYAKSLEKLFPDTKFKTWMSIAQEHQKWANYLQRHTNQKM